MFAVMCNPIKLSFFKFDVCKTKSWLTCSGTCCKEHNLYSADNTVTYI